MGGLGREVEKLGVDDSGMCEVKVDDCAKGFTVRLPESSTSSDTLAPAREMMPKSGEQPKFVF